MALSSNILEQFGKATAKVESQVAQAVASKCPAGQHWDEFYQMCVKDAVGPELQASTFTSGAQAAVVPEIAPAAAPAAPAPTLSSGAQAATSRLNSPAVEPAPLAPVDPGAVIPNFLGGVNQALSPEGAQAGYGFAPQAAAPPPGLLEKALGVAGDVVGIAGDIPLANLAESVPVVGSPLSALLKTQDAATRNPATLGEAAAWSVDERGNPVSRFIADEIRPRVADAGQVAGDLFGQTPAGLGLNAGLSAIGAAGGPKLDSGDLGRAVGEYGTPVSPLDLILSLVVPATSDPMDVYRILKGSSLFDDAGRFLPGVTRSQVDNVLRQFGKTVDDLPELPIGAAEALVKGTPVDQGTDAARLLSGPGVGKEIPAPRPGIAGAGIDETIPPTGALDEVPAGRATPPVGTAAEVPPSGAATSAAPANLPRGAMPGASLEEQMAASLKLGREGVQTAQTAANPRVSVFDMKKALDDAGLDSSGTASQVAARYRGMQAQAAGGIGTTAENTSNAARKAYAEALERSGDPETARLAARRAAAQEQGANAKAAKLNQMMDALKGGEVGNVRVPDVDLAAARDVVAKGARATLDEVATVARRIGVAVSGNVQEMLVRIQRWLDNVMAGFGPGGGLGAGVPTPNNRLQREVAEQAAKDAAGSGPKARPAVRRSAVGWDATGGTGPKVPQSAEDLAKIKQNEQFLKGAGTKALSVEPGPGTSWWDEAWGTLGLPRTITASLDVGGLTRQGQRLGWADPAAWKKAAKDGVTALLSEDAAVAARAVTESNPWYGFADSVGLKFYDWGDGIKAGERAPDFVGLNESWVSSKAADLIPWLTPSERAHATFMNTQGMEVFGKYAQNMWDKGVRDSKAYKDLALVVNHARGYGTGKITDILASSQTFFSARNTTSLFESIFDPFTKSGSLLQPSARQLAAKSLAGMVAGQTALLGFLGITGAMAGGLWTVNANPFDSDFGKLKIGNTRIDTMAGYGPIIRLVSRIAGQASDASGLTDDMAPFWVDWRSELVRFFRNKLDPKTGLLVSALVGEDYKGDPFELKPELLADMLLPMIVNSAAESISNNEGKNKLLTLLTVPAESVGLGAGTYETPTDARNRVAEAEIGEAYDNLSPIEQAGIDVTLSGRIQDDQMLKPWKQADDWAFEIAKAKSPGLAYSNIKATDYESLYDFQEAIRQEAARLLTEQGEAFESQDLQAQVNAFMKQSGIQEQQQYYRQGVIAVNPQVYEVLQEQYDSRESDFPPPKYARDVYEAIQRDPNIAGQLLVELQGLGVQ